MYKDDRLFYQDRMEPFKNKLFSKAFLETEKQCAYNDLISDESASTCEYCIFKDGTAFDGDDTLCNRCIDLCIA